ncbi:dGTP triphosphohydrolase [Geosporobacter ferrireducens]|uniref:dGTP triphosphohydrolase n=1 Tax=Geosporobacter ferrireducens TaxID=1424294 RepID=UPI0023540203|nr:dNTP triphosphohydrolase [Geosporobacter ferrireducens]
MNRLFLREDMEQWERENLSSEACKSYDKKYKASRVWEEEDDPYRTAFQRDVSRIIYSNPFRRLRTKNQVIYLPFDQHNRTRLTHSIEVAHLSRQVARALSLNEDLAEAIALGHDLGHTPFGHAGERALNEFMQDEGGFSHNAQSVWLVEFINQQRSINGRSITGLNLTYATREGILKHTKVKTNISEYQRFNPNDPGTLEAQLVNKCDSLAYLNHDIEDASRNKFINKQEIKNIWNKYVDIPFDKWYGTLINDLVDTTLKNGIVTYSEDFQTVYDEMKKFLDNEIIYNPIVQKADANACELMNEMLFLLSSKPELLPKNKDNKYKEKKYKLKRVIVDYIQWLGDHNFEAVLKNLKKKATV